MIGVSCFLNLPFDKFDNLKSILVVEIVIELKHSEDYDFNHFVILVKVSDQRLVKFHDIT